MAIQSHENLNNKLLIKEGIRHNPVSTERERLYHLVKHHDEELFHGMGAKMTETFGCDKTAAK